MATYRLEFRLTMPGINSWNGQWSGSGQNYVIYKNVPKRLAKKLDVIEKQQNNFYYRWDDGWSSNVQVRMLNKGEKKQKSDGFCGYDWMVKEILTHGEIRNHE